MNLVDLTTPAADPPPTCPPRETRAAAWLLVILALTMLLATVGVAVWRAVWA